MKNRIWIFLIFLIFINKSFSAQCFSYYSDQAPDLPPMQKTFQTITSVRRIDSLVPLENLTYHVLRSSYTGSELEKQWETQNIFDSTNIRSSLLNPVVKKEQGLESLYKALDLLYSKYSLQGPERSENVGLYKSEDKDRSKRTTHFLTMVNGEPIAHIQVQHSLSEKKPLNLENHFKEAESFVRSGRPKHVVEIGRFQILKSNQVVSDQAKTQLGSELERAKIFLDIWLKVSSWLVNDAKPDIITFQVNSKILIITERQFSPFKIKDKLKVFSPNSSVGEWLVKFSLKEMKELREILFAQKMKVLVTDFLNKNGVELSLSIEPNEVDLHQDFKTYGLSQQFFDRQFQAQFQKSVNPFIKNLPFKITYSYDEAAFGKTNMIRIGRIEAQALLNSLNARLKSYP